MAKKPAIVVICLLVLTSLLLLGSFVSAQKKPAEPMMIKLEGGKLPPVPFSHTSHAEKEKIDCAVCHHKDKDVNNPQPCVSCHLIKEVKDNAAIAKEAYHKNCITCHKDSAAKGKAAPVKCNECHKK